MRRITIDAPREQSKFSYWVYTAEDLRPYPDADQENMYNIQGVLFLNPHPTLTQMAKIVLPGAFDVFPQSFWNEYHAQHGEAPKGFWHYPPKPDGNHLYGEPVFEGYLKREFDRCVLIALAKGARIIP